MDQDVDFFLAAGYVCYLIIRADMGAEQTDMQNKLPPINSPSAGKDEKTTWG